MSKDERNWHPNFLNYMQMIVNHPNYKGLYVEIKRDGSVGWVATAKSQTGKLRIEWCEKKARELGFKIQPGVYADVMLAIHPTKWKVCQICGKEMSLYYHYPNANFCKSLNTYFDTNYNECDHISDIWDDLLELGFSKYQIADFLIKKGELNLNPRIATKDQIIDSLELACRKGNKKCLGPGAMSNFPDRFDGFHSYNRCCRSTQDKGRSRENLKSYTKDRRAFEYWSDGNIHAANQFMGSSFFYGTSADHIGPISLGFVHDPHYLQPMSSGDNSTKRDRLLYEDIDKILLIERKCGIYPMSWYSKVTWEYIKENYKRNPQLVSTVYRDLLKQNMANFMFILWTILCECKTQGEKFLLDAYLKKNYVYFQHSYEFDQFGNIIRTEPRHFTDRVANEWNRYVRIAFESVKDYNNKDNRNQSPDLTRDEMNSLYMICRRINMRNNLENIKANIDMLLIDIQNREIQQCIYK